MLVAASVLLLASWSMDVWVAIPPRPEDTVSRADDEVVVNGERIRRLEIRVKTDHRTKTPLCTLKRESGDPKLDAALCAEAVACDSSAKRRTTLEACLMPRVEAALRLRYPGRDIGRPVPYDRKP